MRVVNNTLLGLVRRHAPFPHITFTKTQIIYGSLNAHDRKTLVVFYQKLLMGMDLKESMLDTTRYSDAMYAAAAVEESHIRKVVAQMYRATILPLIRANPRNEALAVVRREFLVAWPEYARKEHY